jgi:hypothetical protein
MSDVESKDFFRDGELVDDPHPYLAALRSKCPVPARPDRTARRIHVLVLQP